MSKLSQLGKIRCFVLDRAAGTPCAGVTVSLSLETATGSALTLGLLTSDRAGYVSFDLSRFDQLAAVRSVWLTPLAEPAARLEVLAAPAALGIGKEATPTASAGPLACLPFTLRVGGGQATASSTCNNPTLPAVQAADPCDYRLSPASFVTSVAHTTGDGCCENILPSVLPVQELTFRRVVTMPATAVSRPLGGTRPDGALLHPSIDPIDVATMPVPPTAPISFAEVLEYQQQWFAIGHCLGEIRYSLALAPGEAVNIAVVDWSRQDTASRTDTITSTEYLNNQLTRDRSIAETVSSMLDETQDGWSLMGGTAGDSSYQYDTFKIAGDHSVGGAIAHSSGDRNLQGDSLQSLHDQTNQMTATFRNLTATVVLQGTQDEQNFLQTRRVANHNHCHALTVEYYEVLRQYRLVTAFTGRRKAILIPFAPFAFDWKVALRFRPLLAPNLLDVLLAPNFDAIVRYNLGPDLYPPTQPATGTTSQYFTGTRTVVVDPQRPTSATAFGIGLIQKGSKVQTIATTATQAIKFDPADPKNYDPDGVPADADMQYYAPGKRQLSLVCRLGSTWYQGGMNSEFVSDTDDDYLVLQPNDTQGGLGNNSGAWIVNVTVTAPAASTSPPAPTPFPTGDASAAPPTQAGDAFAQAVLLQHLNDNRGYYNRIVWLTMDPSDRQMFVAAALAGYPALAPGVDSTPLAVSGNIVAFPFDGTVPNWVDQKPDDVTDPVESIVALPTRGVFAEAMLGHCNACEKRDVARMSDWTLMTEEEPPTISGIAPGPKGTAPDVTQGTLPQNVIQISQPPAAPDPTGLAAALRVLGTPNIFRDDTGLQQLSTLLGTLANGAVTTLTGAQKVAQQAQQQIQAMQSQQGQSGAAAGGTTQQPRPTAAQTYDNLTAAKEVAAAAQDLGWSPQTTEAVTSDLVSGGLVAAAGGAQLGVGGKGLLPANATPAAKIGKILALFGDAPISSGDDINALFAGLGGNGTYVNWLQSRAAQLGMDRNAGYQRWMPADAAGRTKRFHFNYSSSAEANFLMLWNGIPAIFAAPSINLLQFLALDMVTHVEGYGDYAIVSEAQREGYGLDYFFEPNWLAPNGRPIAKASYNTMPTNRSAASLFQDADFQSAHQALFPTGAVAWSANDPAWAGSIYGATKAPTTTQGDSTAYIRQADFYKFRGRGYIQTTSRVGYLALARFLRQNIDQIPSPVWAIVSTWADVGAADAVYQSNLTKSRDDDWQNLFQMSGGVVASLALQSFNQANNNCFQINLDAGSLNGAAAGSVGFLGDKVNQYGSVLSAAVTAVILQMYDSLT